MSRALPVMGVAWANDMPLLMLVHERDRGPDPHERSTPAPWEPNWRVWRWALPAALLIVAAVSTSGGVATLLLLTAFGFCCRSLTEAIPYGDGLREWRQ